MQDLLVIMAKEPRPGFVKTRLSPALDPEAAAALYECFLRDILHDSEAEFPDLDLSVAFDPLTARPWFSRTAPERFDCLPQRGADLGGRLTNVFVDARNFGYRKVAVRNSDSPLLSPDVVRAAFVALEEVDVAISPDGQGGYSLIAACAPHRPLFQDIPMSTDSVLEATLEQARDHSLRVALLDPSPDLDLPEELRAFAAGVPSLSPGEKARIPRTLAKLAELGLLSP